MSAYAYSYSPAPQPRPSTTMRLLAVGLGGLALFFGFLIVWTLGYQLIYAGRIFPGVTVAGVDISGLNPAEAAVKLNQTLSFPINGKVILRDGGRIWVVSPAELGMVFDASSSAQAAYRLGRSGGLFGALTGQIRARSQGQDVSPVIVLDQRVAYAYLQSLSSQINQPVVEASLRLDGTNVIAEPGQVGRVLDVDATILYLTAQLQTFRDGEVPLVIHEQAPQVMDVSAQADMARQILSEPLRIVVPNAAEGDPGPWFFEPPVLANLLVVQRVDNGGRVQYQLQLDPALFRQSLMNIAAEVDRLPENARFYFDDPTAQLVLIESAKVGRVTDIEASIAAINEAIQRGEHTVPLVVTEAQPAVNDAATAESLGITQLVSTQTSYFYGSSAERIQNIQTAAARFHGVFVAPGETFSMGQVMGDVSLENGFAEALIIYGGRTIKGVGGGVCQVSTTLFRTVFFGGYPIVERVPHAYRVTYYEMVASGERDSKLAGMDATVYFPLVDFKFTNDMPYWILMETYVDPGARTLTWKFYSTSDGRTVTWETTGPQNVVNAPDSSFVENPDLKKNEIKQVDWAADGADVVVTRTVWRNGAVLFQDEIKTHYEPWQAVCEFGPGTEDPEKTAKRKGLCSSPN
ncbi:MAG: VanW family protein [Chloroflexota bacterium]